ncbi:hypothetical protein FRC11_011062 [Ceratobasidium sp. 423]|nr:hypothetical protein FRC11_011062 [Ceratobasidium sp. 423]
MPPRVVHRWPDVIGFIFDGHTIQPENISLEPESLREPAKGQVITRALDGFVFVKAGKFAYPRYGMPDEWWKDVVVYGYTVALSGAFRYFVWAGLWAEDYYDKHIEVVTIGNIVGLSKETSDHWRNGKQEILWLETELGFSYALLSPADQYDRGNWSQVTESWKVTSDDAPPTDPKFVALRLEDPRPDWWDAKGDDAWEHLMGSSAESGESEIEILPVPAPCAHTKPRPEKKLPQEHIVVDSGSSDEEQPEAGSPNPVRSRSNSDKAVGEDKGKGQRGGTRRPPALSTIGRTKKRANHIMGDSISSDEETPASIKGSQRAKVGKRAGKRNTPSQLTTPGTIPPNVRTLKRRVFSGGRPNPRPRRKPKAIEHIYVESDSSGDEGSAPMSRTLSPNLIRTADAGTSTGRGSSLDSTSKDGAQSASEVASNTDGLTERVAHQDTESSPESPPQVSQIIVGLDGIDIVNLTSVAASAQEERQE